MDEITKNDFSLDKVKLLKDGGGLDVVYKETIRENGATYQNEIHEKRVVDVHPDLRNKMKQLAPILAHVYHFSVFNNLAQMEEFGATPQQLELINNAYKEILDKIYVTGFALSGQDENMGIVITGTFKADTNQVMAINSHRMKFTGTTYGFEEDMETIVWDIEDEVFEYLKNNKKAQLDLFSGIPTKGEDNEDEEEAEEIEDDMPEM